MSTGKAPGDPAAPAVELRGLVKRYGQIAAVDGLSLTAARGDVTGILGPNGAGKTTTIEICEGYRRPDQGTVRVLGLDPARDARALRPRVGVMLQSGGIPPSVPAADYLKLLSSFHVSPIDPAQRRRPRSRREHRHERSSFPVSSRNTSSSVRLSIRRLVASTPRSAHHAVTAASSGGSTAPGTSIT